MGILELFLIGIGLSMDAFAVAVCKGLGMRRINKGQAAVVALFFGSFQALMPLIGWTLGRQFAVYIIRVDHWISFLLLTYLGGKMVWEALRGEESVSSRFDLRELFLLAVATSIDALAVGITFAFLRVEILSAIAVIGCTTFVLSLLGVVVGNRFGSRYQQRAEITGGAILILIGLKILLEHLGVL